MRPMMSTRELPQAWYVDQLEKDTSWTRHLSSHAIAGLQAAVQHAQAAGKDWLSMAQEDFPLNEAARQEIGAAYRAVQGRWGFCLLKGFPVQDWTPEDARLAMWGVGLHMGVARTQSKTSSLMSDVRDTGNEYKRKGGRGYDTRAKLDFHNDSCDVVGLLCLKQAKSGGVTKITSSMALVEEVRRRRPDLAPVLKEHFYYDQLGTQAPGALPYYHAPLLGSHPVHFGFRTNRKNMMLAQNEFSASEVPRLTQQQIELLDLLDELMPQPDICYSMLLEPGDLQLVNNFVIVHSRTEFEDYEEPERKRHLLRLWLAVPDSQPLSPDWADYYGSADAGVVRGGLRGSDITPAFLEFEQRQAKRMGMPVAQRFQKEYDALVRSRQDVAA
jgi:hypothetical protein